MRRPPHRAHTRPPRCRQIDDERRLLNFWFAPRGPQQAIARPHPRRTLRGGRSDGGGSVALLGEFEQPLDHGRSRGVAHTAAGDYSVRAVALVALDLGIDMTTPNGRLVASILVAVAEWEREMIGQRIKEGLAQSDKTLGRLPGMPKQGGAVVVPPPDTVLAAVQDLHAAGHGPRRIAERLNAHGHPTPRGGRWHRTSVRRLLARLDANL